MTVYINNNGPDTREPVAPRTQTQGEADYLAQWRRDNQDTLTETEQPGLIPLPPENPWLVADRDDFLRRVDDSDQGYLARTVGAPSRPDLAAANHATVAGGYRHADGSPVLSRDGTPLWEHGGQLGAGETVYRNDRPDLDAFVQRATRQRNGDGDG